MIHINVDLDRLDHVWKKWESIALYFFFAVKFNFTAYFWIMPDIYTLFYFIILLTLSLFPLYFKLELFIHKYVSGTAQRMILYRFSTFFLDIIFGSFTFVMKLPLSIFSYSLLISLLIGLFILTIIVDHRISRSGTFFIKTIIKVISILPSSFILYFVIEFILSPEEFLTYLPYLPSILVGIPLGLIVIVIVLRFKDFIKEEEPKSEQSKIIITKVNENGEATKIEITEDANMKQIEKLMKEIERTQ